MQDDNWVIKDKINQYRGLIKLYERDRKIHEGDLAKQKRRYSRDIRQLRKDIAKKRQELGVAVYGDKQFLRNAFQEHKRLQLTYMNSQADLESAELHDRLLYEVGGKLPAEKKEQAVANYVQRANIKKNAALAIKVMYKKILDILKKDSSYFTVVLEALKLDCRAQGKCLMGATEMGQLAMEYLDDRKFEFNKLEKEIKANMKERERTLKLVRREVAYLTDSFPNLIRKEDFFVFLRLKEQKYQSERLMMQLAQNSVKRDALIEDRKHAILMLDSLKNVGQERTAQYIQEKRQLKAALEAEQREEKNLIEALNEKGNLIIQMKTSLQQINQLLSCVGAPNVPRQTTPMPAAIQYALDDIIQPVPQVEEDLDKLILNARQKLNVLMQAVSKMDVTKDIREQAYLFYHNILARSMRDNYIEEAVMEGGLIEFEIEDPNVPSHAIIKLRSKQLVEAQVSEFDVPDYPAKK
ncbi:unnamed protein product [Parnassius apollo]|uniref:(apollo) hypothetical protein n=1 Tax=Parnassius apollo TaxID=110799 RepID=A0A8S3XZC0_PARAO|nr:unnamed protein product [Parnassius apollo]